jgi:hypothetical protein
MITYNHVSYLMLKGRIQMYPTFNNKNNNISH